MEDYEARQIELAKSGVEQEFYSNALFAEREVNVAGEVTFDISTTAFDSHKSIVNVRGIDHRTRYEKNPIVLFNHDYDKPVGRSMWVKMPNPERTVLRAGMKFTEATQTARDTRALVADGVLRGASIGFIPKGSKFDDEAKKAFEADFSDLGTKAPADLEWYVPSCELCEWSIVSVPSNTDTLKNSLSKIDPYLRMAITSELFGEKIEFLEKNYKEILEAVNELTIDKLSFLEQLKAEHDDRLAERKQLIELFKDALKARDVSPKKVETLGLNEVESLIEKIIKKKKGIVK